MISQLTVESRFDRARKRKDWHREGAWGIWIVNHVLAGATEGY